MGDYTKYPYPTMGSMNILTLHSLRKLQNALPPIALRIPKSFSNPHQLFSPRFPLFTCISAIWIANLSTTSNAGDFILRHCPRIFFLIIFRQTTVYRAGNFIWYDRTHFSLNVGRQKIFLFSRNFASSAYSELFSV